jgi:uncharacterized membrane protein YGL010W
MKTADEWFELYSESHRNPLNKKIHWVCIPLIVVSLLGVLASIPLTLGLPWLNLATVVAVGALAYYVLISPRLAAGMAVVTAVSFAMIHVLAMLPVPLWLSCLAVFAGAWVGQFVGHEIEGKKPSFFEDLQFLLIGPLWLLGATYRRAGLRY